MTEKLRVLHLEDSPRDAEMIHHRLDTVGVSCHIIVVNSRESFETALIEEAFDLILLDYNLPDYDGISALRQARLAQPDVPVILISGTVGDEDAVRSLHFGATDYLLKDRLERLGPAVERALQEADTRRTRQRAEAALKESEARKTAILDSVLDCIITMDAAGAVIEFNRAAERTLGHTKAEAIGRSLADLIIPPRYREQHRAGLAHYLATGEGPWIGKVIETAAMRSDGTEIPIELAITAVRTDAVTVFTAVIRDITARQQAEETSIRLAAIVKSSDDAIFCMSLDGTLLTWNAGAERLYGYTAAEMLGRNRAFLASTANNEHFESILQKAVRGDANEPYETHRMRKDGSIIDISLVISPMTDSVGHVTSVSIIARDITSQKKAEASVRNERDRAHEYLKALRTAEERTQFVLRNAHVGVWDMDYTTGVLRWSDTLEAQYGLEPGTFGGTFEDFLTRIHPDDRASVLETWGKAMISGAEFSVLNRAVWPDGTERWLSGAGRVLLGAGGEPARGVGISLDVTERRSLEQQFRQAQKMEAVGQLAGGIAHDFNNLLTVILGFCELLLSDLNANDPHEADIIEIQRAGTRAAGLTRQLLSFSRKQIIEPMLLDLNVVVTGMQAMLGRLIREDVKIVLGLQPRLACVMADRGEVEQVIMNLAVNARDAMPQGGTLTIETAEVELDQHYAKMHLAVKTGPYVVVTMTDTGTGMTPEVKARMFEPFFTTKEPGKGTGLGMATVFGIMTRNGGSVDVQSEIGKGTSFKVFFPTTNVTEIVGAGPASPAAPAVRKRTVLLVEDEDGLRELTQRLLHRLGYTVVVAAGTEEAIRVFDATPYVDVLLTDVVMPGASGPQLVEQLATRRPGLKVIYMSGYTDESIVQHGVLNSGIAFLHKPFTSDTLGRKIRDVLDRDASDRPVAMVT